jgi:hypothetical protein
MSDWKALSAWNHEWFKASYGELTVGLNTSIPGFREMQLGAYIDLILNNDGEALRTETSALYMDAANINLFPGVDQYIRRPHQIPEGRWLQEQLWIGPVGTVLNLHRDNWKAYGGNFNLIAQVVGRKRIVLISPLETHLVYAEPFTGRDYQHSAVNLERPDYEKHPLFAQARQYETVLNPGEMLFIPPDWWHFVRSLDASISVTFWWVPRILELVNEWEEYLRCNSIGIDDIEEYGSARLLAALDETPPPVRFMIEQLLSASARQALGATRSEKSTGKD